MYVSCVLQSFISMDYTHLSYIISGNGTLRVKWIYIPKKALATRKEYLIYLKGTLGPTHMTYNERWESATIKFIQK